MNRSSAKLSLTEHLAVVEKALSGESVRLERTDTTTGQTGWFFHEPVKETGWSVVLARFEDEILVTGRLYRRRVILIAVITTVGLASFAGWIAGVLYSGGQKTRVLWGLAAFTSVIMLAGMEVIRVVTFDQVSDEDRETVKVLDEDSLSSFVRSQRALWARRSETPAVTVRTGILVRTVAFRAAKEVFVTGVVWQRFTDDGHAGIPRGVDFPDAIQHELTEFNRQVDLLAGHSRPSACNLNRGLLLKVRESEREPLFAAPSGSAP